MIQKFSKLNIFSKSPEELLLIFYPLILITGPFLSDLIIVISFLYCFYLIIKKKILIFKFSDLESFLFIFFLISILTSLINYKFDFLSLKSLVFVRFYFFILIVNFLLNKHSNLYQQLFLTTIFSISLICIDAYFQLIMGYNLLGFEKTDPKRLSGLFNDEFILGSFLLNITPLIFYCFNNKKYQNFVLIFFLFFVEPVIFFSGQRGPFFLSLIFILAIFIINFRNKIFYLLLFYLVFLIGGNLIFNKKYHQRFVYDVTENFKYDNKLIGKKEEKKINFSILTPSHTKLYFTSIQMYLDKKLLGHGMNSFRKKCEDYKNQCSTHPHNYYLQILAECGIFSFLVFFLIFVFIVKDLLLSFFRICKTKSDLNISFYYCSLHIFLLLFPFKSTGNLFNNYNFAMIAFIFGIYLNIRNKIKNG